MQRGIVGFKGGTVLLTLDPAKAEKLVSLRSLSLRSLLDKMGRA